MQLASFEENVQQFKEIPGTLPIDLDERLITDVKSVLLRGIGQLLYHPTCRSKYNYFRLERSKKRKISSDEASGSIVVTRSHEQSSENNLLIQRFRLVQRFVCTAESIMSSIRNIRIERYMLQLLNRIQPSI